MNRLNDAVNRRDAERDLGDELLAAVDEMLANQPAKVYVIEQTDVALARQKAQLSQTQFAEILGISVRTLESWEQGKRKPSGAAQSLIKLFIKNPKFVMEELA